MSRIGLKPIPLPAGVTIRENDGVVSVAGPKGSLEKRFHQDMAIEVKDGVVLVKRPSDEKTHRSLHGLTRTLLANMVQGVTEGYEKTLEISGMGYRVQKVGDKLVLNLGFIRPVEISPPDGVTIDVLSNTSFVVKGIDKEAVGQVSADIRRLRPPEPYRGSGVRYKGEKIRRKAAKATK